METTNNIFLYQAPLPGDEEAMAPRIPPVEEDESDGSANAFEGAEHLREYDDRDISDKDLDDLLPEDC